MFRYNPDITRSLNVGDADSHSVDEAEAAVETERLNAQLEKLTEQRNALLLERAEWANKEFRIRILLELADENEVPGERTESGGNHRGIR